MFTLSHTDYQNEVATILHQIRILVEQSRVPEQLLLQALVDEAAAWQERLDVLNLPDRYQ